MSQSFDFEQQWLSRFSRCLDATAGAEVREQVLQGSEGLSDQSSREQVIAWSRAAMERLDALVDDEQKRRDIMTGCACQYPTPQLEPIRAAYQETGDLDLVHQMLQEQFESMLRDRLQLKEAMI